MGGPLAETIPWAETARTAPPRESEPEKNGRELLGSITDQVEDIAYATATASNPHAHNRNDGDDDRCRDLPDTTTTAPPSKTTEAASRTSGTAAPEVIDDAWAVRKLAEIRRRSRSIEASSVVTPASKISSDKTGGETASPPTRSGRVRLAPLQNPELEHILTGNDVSGKVALSRTIPPDSGSIVNATSLVGTQNRPQGTGLEATEQNPMAESGVADQAVQNLAQDGANEGPVRSYFTCGLGNNASEGKPEQQGQQPDGAAVNVSNDQGAHRTGAPLLRDKRAALPNDGIAQRIGSTSDQHPAACNNNHLVGTESSGNGGGDGDDGGVGGDDVRVSGLSERSHDDSTKWTRRHGKRKGGNSTREDGERRTEHDRAQRVLQV